MGKANVFGPSSVNQGGNALFDAVFVDFDDTDTWPIVSQPMPLEHFDGCGIQLVSGGARTVTVLDGDNVDESSRTWRFASGNFSENDVGASFTVAGSSEGNDDIYTVESVTNAFTVVSVESPAADEDFDPDAVTVELVQASPFGSWEFRISNSYVQSSSTQTPNDGSPWTPMNDQFVPAIVAVSEQYIKDTANSANQFCQAYPLEVAAVQLRFTPTAGAGPVSALLVAKGNR